MSPRPRVDGTEGDREPADDRDSGRDPGRDPAGDADGEADHRGTDRRPGPEFGTDRRPDGTPGDHAAGAWSGLDPRSAVRAWRSTLRDDPTRAAVGTLLAVAGALFLVQPAVGWVAVGSLRVRPVALSVLALTAAMLAGAVLFLGRGRRLVGIGHAGMGVGWGLALAGTVAGSGPALVGGAGAIAGTALFLVARSRERRA